MPELPRPPLPTRLACEGQSMPRPRCEIRDLRMEGLSACKKPTGSFSHAGLAQSFQWRHNRQQIVCAGTPPSLKPPLQR